MSAVEWRVDGPDKALGSAFFDGHAWGLEARADGRFSVSASHVKVLGRVTASIDIAKATCAKLYEALR